MELKRITREELNEVLRKHKLWLESDGKDGEQAVLIGYDLSDSNLSGSNLSRSDLSRSNLSGANIDYSCLPLWCGSLKAYFDDKQIIQIIYHAVKAGVGSPNVSDELKRELYKMADVANRFHRAEECGKIEVPEDYKNEQ